MPCRTLPIDEAVVETRAVLAQALDLAPSPRSLCTLLPNMASRLSTSKRAPRVRRTTGTTSMEIARGRRWRFSTRPSGPRQRSQIAWIAMFPRRVDEISTFVSSRPSSPTADQRRRRAGADISSRMSKRTGRRNGKGLENHRRLAFIPNRKACRRGWPFSARRRRAGMISSASAPSAASANSEYPVARLQIRGGIKARMTKITRTAENRRTPRSVGRIIAVRPSGRGFRSVPDRW